MPFGAERPRPFSFARANPLGSLLALGRHPVVLGLTGTMMCSYLAQWILIGTGLLARFGPPGASPHIPGAPFFAAAAFNTIGLLLALRLFSRSPPPPLASAGPS